MNNFENNEANYQGLVHPKPTHPAYIPEPPTTPVSPHGYQRFGSSPPAVSPQPPHAHPHPHAPYAAAPPAPAPYGVPVPPAQFQHAGPARLGQPAPVPAVDFGAWGMNDATAQFGMQLGQSAVAAGQDYVSKNFGGALGGAKSLKPHFNVSNSYVMYKLRLLVFPWRHRPWTRKVVRSEQGQNEWLSPREDVNSPDLYIPVMALVTYILLAALQAGLRNRFHPEILGVSASKALAVVILDFLFVRLGCYFLNITGPGQFVDIIAYGGYKFVGVIMTLVAGMLNFGRTIYSIVFLYAFLATGFFLLRSLRSLVLPDPATATAANVNVNHAQRSRRITFLFLVAVSQIVYMGILVRV